MVGKKGQEEGTNTSRLSLFFLGHPQIERDGVPIKVDTRKGVALLCYLAVTGQSPSRDVLTNLLWPEYDQAHARNDLRYTLSTLNKALGGSWLEVEKDSVGLKRGEGLWVDVDQFHRHLSECQTHGHPLAEVCPDCVNPLTEAVRLYRGDFLAGFGLRDSVNFDDWQFFQTQSLCSEVEGVLEKLVLCHRGRDELEMAIGYARRWLELDRDNEKVHWHLMELYALSGQHAAALRQYRECVKVLKKELGASPQEETTQLYEAIKGKWLMAKLRSFKPSSAFPNVPSSLRVKSPSHSLSSESGQTLNGMRERSLPIQLTSFIGRKREIVEVKRLLITTRLLTLTGPGGCGKTRLALQAASGLLKKFTDGVWLVELAALSNPYLIPQAVAGALNVSEQSGRPLLATLSDYLQSKRLLLVLDNCEHLIEACATLCDSLLHACPNLRILATSREALSIAGETVWCVPALSFPDPRLLTAGADPSTGLRQAQSGSSEPALTLSETRGKGQALVSALTQYEAISLFIDRAVAVLQGFAVTDQNAPAVAQICYRLDGIPLAIELAAACVNVLSVEQIATQLDDCFRLLTEGSRTSPLRQQTLRATMDWSYNLLSEVEQVLFRRPRSSLCRWCQL
jgi:predicted ATPase/DNA-binding SARP family transcriptional activator